MVEGLAVPCCLGRFWCCYTSCVVTEDLMLSNTLLFRKQEPLVGHGAAARAG